MVLIGVGYVNFSGKEDGINKTLETASTNYSNNIGDVQLVSTEGSLVENDGDSKESKETSQENKSEDKTETNSKNEKDKSKSEAENKSDTQTSAIVDEKENNSSNGEKDNSSSVSKDNETISTNASNGYFTELKLKRDNIYSQKLEVYSQMINSSTISSEQKAIAIQEVSTITETQNAIQVAEELIKLKGFENVVIYVNGDSVSVVVRSAALSLEQVAQIQNIVSRELKTDVSKISISNK